MAPSIRSRLTCFVAPQRIALTLLTAFTAGSCGSADRSEDDPEDSPAAEAESIEIDACDLLTAADASGVLGGAVGPPTRGVQTAGDARTAAISSCGYEGPAGRTVNLMARLSPTPNNTPSAIQNVREGSGALGQIQDVADVGDTAFAVLFSEESTVQLHVFWGGDRYQMVTVAGFPHDVGLVHATSMARLVIERL